MFLVEIIIFHSFTFYYIYINTEIVDILELNSQNFTFYYIYINTHSTTRKRGDENTLHSTIFILILIHII